MGVVIHRPKIWGGQVLIRTSHLNIHVYSNCTKLIRTCRIFKNWGRCSIWWCSMFSTGTCMHYSVGFLVLGHSIINACNPWCINDLSIIHVLRPWANWPVMATSWTLRPMWEATSRPWSLVCLGATFPADSRWYVCDLTPTHWLACVHFGRSPEYIHCN